MSQFLLRTSQCIFLGGHGDSRETSTSFTALLASNLQAQLSRQIVIQILGLESPKVCGNLAVRPRTYPFFEDIISNPISRPKK
jgi:hypothetical protein